MRVSLPLLAVLVLPTFVIAADHESRFQLSADFVANVWKYPVQKVPFTLQCAGPVHQAADDCEIHLSLLLDAAEISDFQYIVGEPPNVCIDDDVKDWRTTLSAHAGHHAEGTGVVRVWPEHLNAGQGCSNPQHFMELHPLLSLDVEGKHYDWSDHLKVVEGLGYKPPATVEKMLSFKLWVRSGCKATRPSFDQPATVPEGCMVDFDYCSGHPCKMGPISNFARLSIRPILDWIRPHCDAAEEARLKDFTTVLARAAPIDEAGVVSDQHHGLVKLYAIKGTSFFDKLRADRACGGTPSGADPSYDVIGTFMVDPLAVVRAFEAPSYEAGDWVEVTFPVAVVVFGEAGQ